MLVQLYQIDCDKRVVDKTEYITNAKYKRDVTVHIKDDCDIMNPELIMEYTNDTSFHWNYVHVGTWHRYYYIVDYVFLDGHRVVMKLSVDPLHTFRESIKRLKCLVKRNEKKGNTALVDNEIVVQNNISVVRRGGWDPVCDKTKYNVYLTVTGGNY